MEARRYTIERCVVAPKNEAISVIDAAFKLTVCAVRREGHQAGNAIVFLPGIQEMLRLRELIKGTETKVCVWMLHSEIVGTDQEEDQDVEDPEGAPLIVLSTIVGPRGVTLPKIRYVFLHPHMRAEALHSSGLSQLLGEPLAVEVGGNQIGRAGREADSLAAF